MLIFKTSFSLRVEVRPGHNFIDYIVHLEHPNTAFSIFAHGFTLFAAVQNLLRAIEVKRGELADNPVDNPHNMAFKSYLDSIVEEV
jgi:hypothetical protein